MRRRMVGRIGREQRERRAEPGPALVDAQPGDVDARAERVPADVDDRGHTSVIGTTRGDESAYAGTGAPAASHASFTFAPWATRSYGPPPRNGTAIRPAWSAGQPASANARIAST